MTLKKIVDLEIKVDLMDIDVLTNPPSSNTLQEWVVYF